jgi:hypothetical protein
MALAGLTGIKSFSNPGSSAWLFQRIVRSMPIGRSGYAKAVKCRADHITVIRATHRSLTP